MRPLISYRCEGAGGGGLGEGITWFSGESVVANRLLERTLTADQLPMRGDHYKASGGGRKKENFTARHVYGVRAHVSIVHFFCLIL